MLQVLTLTSMFRPGQIFAKGAEDLYNAVAPYGQVPKRPGKIGSHTA